MRILVFLILTVGISLFVEAECAPTTDRGIVVAVRGYVEVKDHINSEFHPVVACNDEGGRNPTFVNPGTVLRVPKGGYVEIKLPDGTSIRRGQREQPGDGDQPAEREGPGVLLVPDFQSKTISLQSGLLRFFNRGGTGGWRVDLPFLRLGVKGTELIVEVEEDGSATVLVVEGEIEISRNGHLGVERVLRSLEGIHFDRDSGSLVDLPKVEFDNLIQWFVYYPGVVMRLDLELGELLDESLAESVSAYEAGDVRGALQFLETDWMPRTLDEEIFLAGLWLANGSPRRANELIERSRSLNTFDDRQRRLIASMARVIDSMLYREGQARLTPVLASEWLAESYYRQAFVAKDHQSSGNQGASVLGLAGALEAAIKATEQAPASGFAWVRRAELEFGMGDLKAMARSLARGRELSPRNAQLFVLLGFVEFANGRSAVAQERFEDALRLDSQLGNAWLGLGLSRIYAGDTEAGVNDLATAASNETKRSIFRSYLGKGFAELGDFELAESELALAIDLDPRDPTPWLYRAMLRNQQNRINDSVSDLQESIRRNDQRRLYRSRSLLDSDASVRSANLANIFHDAGLSQLSLRQSAAAVTLDYGNSSAHRFLADSYNALRDPTRFNLRNETIWLNEWLLANLLSKVGDSSLSQQVSQLEYSRFFRRSGLGLQSSSVYRSDGQFQQNVSQFGIFENSAYSVDAEYFYRGGVRPNNDLERFELYATVKEQFTPEDSLMFITKIQEFESGDNRQQADPRRASRDFRWVAPQYPGLLMAGYHHEFSPESQLLVLGGRLASEQSIQDVRQSEILQIDESRDFKDLLNVTNRLSEKHQFEAYTAEVSQIITGAENSWDFGARAQSGTFEVEESVDLVGRYHRQSFGNDLQERFDRASLYAYHTRKALSDLWLTVGLSYDVLRYPENYRFIPVTSGTTEASLWSPKMAFVWEPYEAVRLRGMYSRSLGGVNFDQSIRLERSQLAGFPQSFRSLLSDSVVGSLVAPVFDTSGVALDLVLGDRTYVGWVVQHAVSDAERQVGVYIDDVAKDPPVIEEGQLDRSIDYEENSIGLTINHLAGRDFSFELGYQLTRSELAQRTPMVLLNTAKAASDNIRQSADKNWSSELHRLRQVALFNHPSGWFVQQELNWLWQQNSGYQGDDLMPRNEDVPQLDLYVGYRLAQQRAKVVLGVLNLFDQDYSLNPLTPYVDMPRERVVQAAFSFRF